MAWWETDKAGDKVVCIDGNIQMEFPDDISTMPDPKVGEICTILKIGIDNSPSFISGVFIFLDGFGYDYCASHFRPVQPRSTDKAIKLLKSITA